MLIISCLFFSGFSDHVMEPMFEIVLGATRAVDLSLALNQLIGD